MKYYSAVIVLFLAIGLFFRLYHFGSVPVSLYWDEIAILVDAKAIAATGLDMHGRPWYQIMFPSYGDYKLPVYIWLAAISVKLLGVTQVALRTPALFTGLATMGVTALTGYLLFTQPLGKDDKPASLGWPKLVALFSLLVVAVSPWAIMFSRSGFEGYVGQLFLGLAVAAQLRSNQKMRWLIFVPVFAAIATYSYFSVRFVWPLLFVVAQLLFGLKWHSPLPSIFKQFVITTAIPLLCYAAFLLPMIRSPLYHDSNQFRLSTTSILNLKDYALISNELRELGGNSNLDRVLYHRHVLLFRELAFNLADHLNPNFLFLTGDSNLRHGTSRHGLFLWPFVLPFLIGLFFLLKRYPQQGFYLLWWWLVALAPAAIPDTTPHALRSLNALIPLSLIIGVGCSVLWVWGSEQVLNTESWIRRSLLVFFMAAVTFSLVEFGLYYFIAYPQQSAHSWQAGYKETALFLAEKAKQVDIVYNEFPDIRLYLWIMAFTDIPADQFATWESKYWMFDPVANVTAKTFDPNHLQSNQSVGVFLRQSELSKMKSDWDVEGLKVIAETEPPTTQLYEPFIYVEVHRD